MSYDPDEDDPTADWPDAKPWVDENNEDEDEDDGWAINRDPSDSLWDDPETVEEGEDDDETET